MIVWMPEPSSARSNGSHISMLPPMPMMSSSGRPSPRMAARMRIPSTSTKRMRWSPAACRGLIAEAPAEDAGDVERREHANGAPRAGLDDHRVACAVLEHALRDVGQALVRIGEEHFTVATSPAVWPAMELALRRMSWSVITAHGRRSLSGSGSTASRSTTIACTCSLAIRCATAVSGVPGSQVSTRGRIASATRACSKLGVR